MVYRPEGSTQDDSNACANGVGMHLSRTKAGKVSLLQNLFLGPRTHIPQRQQKSGEGSMMGRHRGWIEAF